MTATPSDFYLKPGPQHPTRAELNTIFQVFVDELNIDPSQTGAEFDIINEATSGSGVTVDSVQMLDGNIILGAANPSIFGNDTDGVMSVSGGATAILGGNIKLYGDTHSTKADDFEVYGSAVLQLLYDDSSSLWDFQANAVTTTGLITGGSLTLGVGAGASEILGGDTDGTLAIAPSTTNALGGNIILYGDTHSSKANDIEFRATAGVELHYDDDNSLWDFQANAINTTGGGSLTGTWSDLGSVTTVDINGGTVDGVTIGGSSAGAITATTLAATGAFDAQANVRFSGTEDIAAGGTTTALSLILSQHMIGADGPGDIFTLANGAVGDIHTIAIDDATGTATITPDTFNGGTSITMDALGDSVTLQWFATIGWTIIGGNSYTII